MNLSAIVHFEGALTVDQMAFVVEQYIYQRKQVRVEIDLKRSRGGILWSVHYADDVQLLSQAYEIAAYWFKEQGI